MTKVPFVRGGGVCVFFGATQLIVIREDTSLSLHMGCNSGRSDESTHPFPPTKKTMDSTRCSMWDEFVVAYLSFSIHYAYFNSTLALRKNNSSKI